MEQKNIWKNFLILTIGSLIVFHINVSEANEDTTYQDSSAEEGCVLDEE